MSRVVVGLLAFVGALALVGSLVAVGLIFYLRSSSVVGVLQSLPAPDQAHTATLYVDSGGGAAGWCNHVVSINSKSLPFSPKSATRFTNGEVYTSTCGHKEELVWLSSSSLQITLSDFVSAEWHSSSLRGMDESGSIKVEFVFKHDQIPATAVTTPNNR